MIETSGWGGIWHYTCCLNNALYGRQLDLCVATSMDFEKPFDLEFNISPVFNRGGSFILNWFQLLRTIYRIKPDVVHFQSWFSARRDWIPFRFFSLLRIPVIITCHNLLPHDSEERTAPFMFWAFKNIYRSASSLIVHSQSNKEGIIQTYGILPGKIAVIRHGNYGFFTKKFLGHTLSSKKHYPNIPQHKRLFLIFGAMRHYKGIDLALKAMYELSSQANIHLIIAGKPYHNVFDYCKTLAEALNISDHVTFIPGYLQCHQIAELHALADVILFPYRDIFQSGSLQIALAFGKPIIATKVGSFPETLNQKNAWLVKRYSTSALSRVMLIASEVGDDVLAAMGKESRRLSEEDHDWSSIAQKTVLVYQQALRIV